MGTPKFHSDSDGGFIHKNGESSLLMEVANPTTGEKPGLILSCYCEAVRIFQLW
jgi:hypothetical protein